MYLKFSISFVLERDCEDFKRVPTVSVKYTLFKPLRPAWSQLFLNACDPALGLSHPTLRGSVSGI